MLIVTKMAISPCTVLRTCCYIPPYYCIRGIVNLLAWGISLLFPSPLKDDHNKTLSLVVDLPLENCGHPSGCD